jgi:ferredoxin
MPGVSTVLVVLKRVVDNGIERAHDTLYQKAALHTCDVLCAACEAIISHSTAFGLRAFWPGRQKTPFQKDLAIAAGLGSRSVSGLFISHQQGIDVHLETVLLGFELQINQKNKQPVYVCDACGLCLDACPAGALEGNVVYPDHCRDYRKNRVKPYQGKTYCGLCMQACPQRNHTAQQPLSPGDDKGKDVRSLGHEK